MDNVEKQNRIEELTVSILGQVPQKVLERALLELPTERLTMALSAIKREAGRRSKPKEEKPKKSASALPFDVKGKAPLDVINQAINIFKDWEQKSAYARKMNYDKDCIVLNVGYRYRLYSSDDGKTWMLYTHEDYNKLQRKLNS